MTVTITIAPEIEAQVTEAAKAEGIAVEDYLPHLIQYALPHWKPSPSLRQGERDWVALLQQAPPVAPLNLMEGQAAMTREDLRRENLYEDRA